MFERGSGTGLFIHNDDVVNGHAMDYTWEAAMRWSQEGQPGDNPITSVHNFGYPTNLTFSAAADERLNISIPSMSTAVGFLPGSFHANFSLLITKSNLTSSGDSATANFDVYQGS